jgi:hypothetical protein
MKLSDQLHTLAALPLKESKPFKRILVKFTRLRAG